MSESRAQASNDSLIINNYEIDDIIVSPNRTPLEEQQASRISTIITKAEIERAPVQSLNDLLRFIAGVDIRQRGPLGVQADISLRGGTFDQTLILLNGVNITDAQTGHNNLNLPIDIESIDRIEILQGPAANSLGANAFNGAINIITGNSKPNHIRASGTYGQFGLFKASANISNTISNFKQFASISSISSDGYIQNTEFLNTSVFYQAGYSASIGTFDLQAGYNNKDFAANSFYSLRFPNQFEATNTEFTSIKYQSNTRIKISSTIYFRRQRDRFELRRDTLPYNHHLTNTSGITLTATAPTRFGKTSIGLGLRNEQIISNILGLPMDVPMEVSGFRNDYYSKYYNRLITGVFSNHSITWKKITLIAGVMAYHNSRITGVSFYPGLDISYKLQSHLTVYSSINKSLRTPTFTDLFYKSPSQQGNQNLVPEKALTIEGGLKYNSSSLRGNISIFKRMGYKMIDWVKDMSSDSLIWRSMNHSNINFSGVEGILSFTPSPENRVERIQTLSLSYTFLNADWNYNNMLSKYTLDYLKHQITLSVDTWIIWKLFVSNRVTYNDRNGLFQDKRGQLVAYIPFWLIDTRVYWKSYYCTLFTEANNILNTKYYDFGGIIQPGIWVRGGILFDLDYRR